MLFGPKCCGCGLKVEDSGFLLFNFSTNGVSFEKLPFLPHINFFCFLSFPGPAVRGTDSRVAGWLGVDFYIVCCVCNAGVFSFSCSAGRILWI